MRDVKDQIRAYYEATTEPCDIDTIAVDEDTVLVGPFPNAVYRRSAMNNLPPEPKLNTTWWKGPRVALVAFVATAAVVLAVFAATRLIDSDATLDPAVSISDPATLISLYVAAYNANDIDAMMAMYTEESVLTGHPYESPSRGIASIRRVMQQERGDAADVNPWKISNIQVTGNTVTWDHVWTNDLGEDWCAEGHSAVIEDGKIQSWAFAPNPEPCPDEG